MKWHAEGRWVDESCCILGIANPLRLPSSVGINPDKEMEVGLDGVDGVAAKQKLRFNMCDVILSWFFKGA